uniref:Uncharacterized protein n=1 Tax=Rhizophora mucronata TaxID=61149 RepID=A0A2P2IR08_RHIMU
MLYCILDGIITGDKCLIGYLDIQYDMHFALD